MWVNHRSGPNGTYSLTNIFVVPEQPARVLWLVLAALLLSLVDALFLLVVADYIGALQTVGLVVVTALLGVLLVRHQGRATIHRIQRRLQGGRRRPTS